MTRKITLMVTHFDVKVTSLCKAYAKSGLLHSRQSRELIFTEYFELQILVAFGLFLPSFDTLSKSVTISYVQFICIFVLGTSTYTKPVPDKNGNHNKPYSFFHISTTKSV